MVHLGIGGDEAVLNADERRWRRETRSASLRLGVFAILVANLLIGEHGGNLIVHATVVLAYGLATAVALGLAVWRRGPPWLVSIFTGVDALAVVALFHEHLFTAIDTFAHSLTATNLAIAFVLLNHVALRLRPLLVSFYAAFVIVGWLSLLIIKGMATGWQDSRALALFEADVALAAAFGFAAFVAHLLIRDHDSLLASALRTERRRHNLSRFFSPTVVQELERAGVDLHLERRLAGVMFVDLRSFTRFSETASAEDLAELLVEYRTHVTQMVFDRGGTVDKFIGDGVMAVFGQPQPKRDDAERAMGCALDLAARLARWKSNREEAGRPALDAGIGLHFGPVISGVLESKLHDEFTVLGDAVNVAERLEGLAKSLGAVLVVSAEVLAMAPAATQQLRWLWRKDVQLEGRSGLMNIAYLVRPGFSTSDRPNEIDPSQHA